MPRFVSDYLVSQLVDDSNPAPGLQKINKVLKEHFFDSEHKELIKNRIQRMGVYSLIGQIRTRFDQSKNCYWSEIPSLGDAFVRIDCNLLDRYGDLLLLGGGMWGKIDITYDPSVSVGRRQYPFVISEFIPLQVTNIDIDHWIDSRSRFTKQEWIDLLINSIGLNPSKIDYEEKLLHLCRIVPFIQPCVHLIELGPTETAKTYAFRNLSPYSHVISGSSTTIASLFYNKVKKSIGLIGYKDVVCFDEITTDNIKLSPEMVNMLKDTLNSGHFSRDNIEFNTDASVCFIGNVECDRDKKSVIINRNHLFSGLPSSIRDDRAFLDRINGCIPGWKFSKISKSNLSEDYGFMGDYFASILHHMRSRNYYAAIVDRLQFGSMSQRNQQSITNITLGLLKLIHPNCVDTKISNDDLMECVNIASYLRKIVLDQLHKIAPKEFNVNNLCVQCVDNN